MPSTILSDNGVTSGTSGIKTTGSNDGTLALQTTTAGGAATTALTINTTQAIGVGSSPSFGTNGQLLTSSGSGAAPTWTTVSVSAATQTALGTVYGETESTGASTTALGYQAFNASSTGTLNTAVGWQALTANSSGNNNTAVGEGALTANTTGSENVAVGLRSLYDNQTGSNNTACGRNALRVNTVSNCTAVGYAAFESATNGGANTALGYNAGAPTTTGSGNTFIGYQTGKVCTTGSANIHLGYNTSTSAAAAANEIVISTNSDTGKGNQTGFIAPGFGSCYQGSNAATWAVTSDRRLKKNIVDNTEGLSKIAQIRVRNFEYRLPEEVEAELKPSDAVRKTGVQLGVIAQELQEVCSDCIKEESTGVLRVDSDNVFWHMVNAIKDLKAINDTQAELISGQAATITALTARIVALENRV